MISLILYKDSSNNNLVHLQSLCYEFTQIAEKGIFAEINYVIFREFKTESLIINHIIDINEHIHCVDYSIYELFRQDTITLEDLELVFNVKDNKIFYSIKDLEGNDVLIVSELPKVLNRNNLILPLYNILYKLKKCRDNVVNNFEVIPQKIHIMIFIIYVCRSKN